MTSSLSATSNAHFQSQPVFKNNTVYHHSGVPILKNLHEKDHFAIDPFLIQVYAASCHRDIQGLVTEVLKIKQEIKTLQRKMENFTFEVPHKKTASSVSTAHIYYAKLTEEDISSGMTTAASIYKKKIVAYNQYNETDIPLSIINYGKSTIKKAVIDQTALEVFEISVWNPHLVYLKNLKNKLKQLTNEKEQIVQIKSVELRNEINQILQQNHSPDIKEDWLKHLYNELNTLYPEPFKPLED